MSIGAHLLSDFEQLCQGNFELPYVASEATCHICGQKVCEDRAACESDARYDYDPGCEDCDD